LHSAATYNHLPEKYPQIPASPMNGSIVPNGQLLNYVRSALAHAEQIAKMQLQ